MSWRVRGGRAATNSRPYLSSFTGGRRAGRRMWIKRKPPRWPAREKALPPGGFVRDYRLKHLRLPQTRYQVIGNIPEKLAFRMACHDATFEIRRVPALFGARMELRFHRAIFGAAGGIHG